MFFHDEHFSVPDHPGSSRSAAPIESPKLESSAMSRCGGGGEIGRQPPHAAPEQSPAAAATQRWRCQPSGPSVRHRHVVWLLSNRRPRTARGGNTFPAQPAPPYQHSLCLPSPSPCLTSTSLSPRRPRLPLPQKLLSVHRRCSSPPLSCDHITTSTTTGTHVPGVSCSGTPTHRNGAAEPVRHAEQG